MDGTSSNENHTSSQIEDLLGPKLGELDPVPETREKYVSLLRKFTKKGFSGHLFVILVNSFRRASRLSLSRDVVRMKMDTFLTPSSEL